MDDQSKYIGNEAVAALCGWLLLVEGTLIALFGFTFLPHLVDLPFFTHSTRNNLPGEALANALQFGVITTIGLGLLISGTALLKCAKWARRFSRYALFATIFAWILVPLIAFPFTYIYTCTAGQIMVDIIAWNILFAGPLLYHFTIIYELNERSTDLLTMAARLLFTLIITPLWIVLVNIRFNDPYPDRNSGIDQPINFLLLFWIIGLIGASLLWSRYKKAGAILCIAATIILLIASFMIISIAPHESVEEWITVLLYGLAVIFVPCVVAIFLLRGIAKLPWGVVASDDLQNSASINEESSDAGDHYLWHEPPE